MKRLAIVLFLAGCVIGAAQTPDCGLVPGWKQKGPARSFVADNLFEYMDGNAEGYLIYQFQKMQGVTCESGANTIVFDVSEFADTESAYGMFAANRDPRQPSEKIGMGGQILPRRAIFVKDKYYVEFAASAEQDNTAVLRQFVTAMEPRVPGRTEVPDELSWFPAENLVPDSARLVPESVLGMRILRRGYIAQYTKGKAFLVRETTPEAAAGVMEKLRGRVGPVQPAKVADEAFQANDKYLGGLCFFRKGRYIAGYANLEAGQDAVALATALAARIP